MATPSLCRPIASDTPEGRERLHGHNCAFGRFVDMFAKVEIGARLVLQYHAKMTTGAVRALLSGVRVEETGKRLQRLVEAGLMSA
jgi:hypothetical protein